MYPPDSGGRLPKCALPLGGLWVHSIAKELCSSAASHQSCAASDCAASGADAAAQPRTFLGALDLFVGCLAGWFVGFKMFISSLLGYVFPLTLCFGLTGHRP